MELRNSEAKILYYYSKLSTPFLHAKGEIATWVLIRQLDCQPGEKILEIGFGTGAILVNLVKGFKQTEFFGAEYSSELFDKAVLRFKFCVVIDKIALRKMETANTLPFENNYFDKIYIESVLAIQVDDSLQKMLLELKRVLKPGGKIVMNETIWLETVPFSRIIEFNKKSFSDFGIIQSNSMFPYLKSWLNLLESLNFEIIFTRDLNTLKPGNVNYNYKNLRSKIFTIIGKLNGTLNSKMRIDASNYAKRMKALLLTDEAHMPGYLIVTKAV